MSALLGRAEPADKHVAHLQYLTFLLGREMFGLSILMVKEIIGYGGLTTVPMMPAAVRGIINLRGAVVPVIDPAALFGMVSAPVTKRSCIVIVESGTGAGVSTGTSQQVIGLVVDAVNAVEDIPASEIEPAPSIGAKIQHAYIAGMGKVSDRFVVLLDAERILSLDDVTGVGESMHLPEAMEALT